MKKIVFISLLVFLSFVCFPQDFSEQDQANFLFEFSRNFKWNQYKENQIEIYVLGETVVIDYLNNMARAHYVAGRKLVARPANADNAVDGNILFITREYNYLLPDFVEKSISKGVLIVTETPNMTSQGADISFAFKKMSSGDSTMSYSYNLNSIENKNIEYTIEFVGYGVR